jgi:signal transduction histidine kinase
MTGLLRTYAIASLVIMAVAGTVVFVQHRSALVSSIEAVAETSSVTTARMALYPIRALLADYVEAANQSDRDPAAARMPMALQESFRELLRDSRVTRIKIYNRRGLVIYSTRANQIGSAHELNPGFATAMAGSVSVQLIYRDTFNTFDQATEDDNLVQTYFPVRRLPTTPVVGVFEVYTDVNALVVEVERAELAMLVGTVAVVACIYAALLILVYISDRQLRAQRKIIQEKNVLLERFSLQSMRREESDRKKFSSELHENLAQSLSAIKLALENVRGSEPAKRGELQDAIIPHLTSAIGHARSIAEDLHPLGLDEFGLGPTVRAMLRELAHDRPLVGVAQEITVDEAAIPTMLKTAVYRSVGALLNFVRDRPEVKQLRLSLQSAGGELELRFEDNAQAVATAVQSKEGAGDPHGLAGELGERVTISKGRLSVIGGESGAPVLRATWQL